jgi:hypothetical protein
MSKMAPHTRRQSATLKLGQENCAYRNRIQSRTSGNLSPSLPGTTHDQSERNTKQAIKHSLGEEKPIEDSQGGCNRKQAQQPGESLPQAKQASRICSSLDAYVAFPDPKNRFLSPRWTAAPRKNLFLCDQIDRAANHRQARK